MSLYEVILAQDAVFLNRIYHIKTWYFCGYIFMYMQSEISKKM